ncbi:MAG: tetratricopeptide repeat protein [Candidatus Eremiobacteraeota bacterium]|nr:tetratricopeptide repeat protein [Candidatus Eremiobacteraeota bacterium]MBV9055088.1 tetratricopeptide repeat protein [Candidatus Eremiobacteraeota bacterium]MBV9698842.1 tetratricopeptide repeat protein [Candidatus Eremiobacteraeota bacterium]
MTYSQTPVVETILSHGVPVQFDNSKSENNKFLRDIHHIWTPDIRILNHDGFELYRWDGFLPPPEFMARTLCGYGMAYLRLKRFDQAEAIYGDVLRRFSTTYAAPEAQYYLGVARYRRDPDSDELLTQWAALRSRYPASEYRVKQSFKELPE